MTAPKKRRTKGNAMRCCKGKVQINAMTTKKTAMASGLTPYSIAQLSRRCRSSAVMLAC